MNRVLTKYWRKLFHLTASRKSWVYYNTHVLEVDCTGDYSCRERAASMNQTDLEAYLASDDDDDVGPQGPTSS